MPPLVSVLLPFRDALPTLEASIASVLAAHGVDLELVAIDDGSRDGGAALVERLAAKDPRIVPIATGGVGIARALAAGLSRARAELVGRMDADDVSSPTRFVRQVEALAADASLAVVGTRVEATPRAEIGPGLLRYVAWQNSLVTPEEHERELFVESPLCHPSVLLRRAAVAAVGGFRERAWPEDYDLWMRLSAAGYRLAKVPEVLLEWRHGPGRLTFSDPRCAPARITEAKAHYLAPRLARAARPVTVWGAGPTGKRFARALEAEGVRAARFVDIDPRKIGGVRRGVDIVGPESVRPGEHSVVVAVGTAGARAEIRQRLLRAGWREGSDFVCVA